MGSYIPHIGIGLAWYARGGTDMSQNTSKNEICEITFVRYNINDLA